MRPTTRTIRAVSVGALFTVSACFKLGRTTPPVEQYVLGGSQITVALLGTESARQAAGLTIGLRRLDLAPYLATPSIVVRRGTQMVTSQFHRWGEDPGAGIPRAVAAYLIAAGRVAAVDIAPWPIRAGHDYLAQLHVTHMEGVAPEDTTATQGDVVVTASWEIIRPLDGALLARGETDRRERGWRVGSYPSLVALVDKGLNGLATDLASCIDRLARALPREATEGIRPMACDARKE